MSALRTLTPFITLLLILFCMHAHANTYTVTTGTDNASGTNPSANAGTGTLRQAIIDANAHAGPDIISFKNYKNGLRLPLFIKKSNDEGAEFYYMGDVTPILDSFEQTALKNDKGQKVSVVKIRFLMNHPVENSIYQYITASTK